MLRLSKGRDEELLAVAGGTAPVVRRGREPDVAPGAEVGGVLAVAGIEVVHAEDLVRLGKRSFANSTFTRTPKYHETN